MMKREFYDQSVIILEAGQIATFAWFIEKGSAVGFIYIDGKKSPFWFWNEGEFMVSFSSFFNQVPSKFYIELLEPTVLLSVSYDHIADMVKGFPESDDMITKVMQNYEGIDENGILDPDFTPEQHYDYLMKNCPELFKKASAESIAGYLGITTKELKRLQRKTRGL